MTPSTLVAAAAIVVAAVIIVWDRRRELARREANHPDPYRRLIAAGAQPLPPGWSYEVSQPDGSSFMHVHVYDDEGVNRGSGIAPVIPGPRIMESVVTAADLAVRDFRTRDAIALVTGTAVSPRAA